MKCRPHGDDEFSTPHSGSNCLRLTSLKRNFRLVSQECVVKVKESFQTYQREGSGWQLQEVSNNLFLLHVEGYSFHHHFRLNEDLFVRI